MEDGCQHGDDGQTAVLLIDLMRHLAQVECRKEQREHGGDNEDGGCSPEPERGGQRQRDQAGRGNCSRDFQIDAQIVSLVSPACVCVRRGGSIRVRLFAPELLSPRWSPTAAALVDAPDASASSWPSLPFPAGSSPLVTAKLSVGRPSLRLAVDRSLGADPDDENDGREQQHEGSGHPRRSQWCHDTLRRWKFRIFHPFPLIILTTRKDLDSAYSGVVHIDPPALSLT